MEPFSERCFDPVKVNAVKEEPRLSPQKTTMAGSWRGWRKGGFQAEGLKSRTKSAEPVDPPRAERPLPPSSPGRISSQATSRSRAMAFTCKADAENLLTSLRRAEELRVSDGQTDWITFVLLA